MELPFYDEDPTDELNAMYQAEFDAAARHGQKGKVVAGIKKPTSTELSIALDTIRDEIAFSKDRNILERQKHLDNPLHAKLPYLTWEQLQGCVMELELHVRTRVTEESRGEAATLGADVLKRSANMERVLDYIHAHNLKKKKEWEAACTGFGKNSKEAAAARKDGTDLSQKGISTALGMHILSVRSSVEKLVAAGAVTIIGKNGEPREFKEWV